MSAAADEALKNDQLEQKKQKEDTLIRLRMSSKILSREAKRFSKRESIEKTKLKKAIQNGGMQEARTLAENAISQKNQVLTVINIIS